jgi:putative membrane protein
MLHHLGPFLIHWTITALSLWAASRIFDGIRFRQASDLVVAALLLGFANALLKPLLIILTFPLTLLTFGIFLLVINALMIMLVSLLVRGFTVSSFWTAFFASILISLLSALMGGILLADDTQPDLIHMPSNGTWI